MKSNIFSLSGLLLLTSLLILPFASNAMDKNKTKKSNWQADFSKHIAYNGDNKELLHASFVLLEVSIDAEGHVTIENHNGNKPQAVEYVVKKLNGLKVQNEIPTGKFIVKYYFR